MIFEKGDKNCNGCKLYGDQCHCLCHKEDYVNGYHEIVYAAGPNPTIIEFPNERE